MSLTKFTLKSNYFMFENKYYLQNQGTSMGSPFAPYYANLFMGLWEDRHIFNNNPFVDNILLLKGLLMNLFWYLWGLKMNCINLEHIPCLISPRNTMGKKYISWI